MLNWRECKGVEPSAHAEGRTPAELKSVRPTGTHPLPHCFVPVRLGTQQDYREFHLLADVSAFIGQRLFNYFVATESSVVTSHEILNLVQNDNCNFAPFN